MKPWMTIGLIAASLLPAAPALTADNPGTLARVFVVSVKPGATAQFEAQRKKHMEFHKKLKDTWAWHMWQVETGPRSGRYLIGTFGHNWKDFDDWAKNEEADGADVSATYLPFVAEDTNAFFRFLPDVSRPPNPAVPAAMSEITHFALKQGGDQDFAAAIGKVHEAIGKVQWPVHYYWYTLVNGGEAPSYALSIPRKNWTDMEDPEPQFPVMLEKALGRQEAGAVFRSLDAAIASQWSELLRYRPDLSYVPAN